ncbi:dihydrolipoyl dehydrogenase [Pseudophaeobacter sp.]|uniref:dihydrolipoyl dehydrogenase n=1 Tax=Pseudophaeobacter sp. TaxID=1971739 RepID=UPI00329863B3
MSHDILIPDLGGITEAPVAEVLVKPGDQIAAGEPLLIVESDKAVLDIPAPADGTITEVHIAVGNAVSPGQLVMRFESGMAAAPLPDVADVVSTAPQTLAEEHAHLVVIGGGPGGYTAAFRAADLGAEVTLIDPRASLGGVCLNVGCIPSKALLHVAKVKEEAEEAASLGLGFAPAQVDLEKVRAFKTSVVTRLTTGLAGLAKRRNIRVIRGTARFASPHQLVIDHADGERHLSFDKAIVAVGSEPIRLPFLPEDPRILDSSGALELAEIPDRLLVIGGGIIGLEMAQVYHALGAKVEIVELGHQILPGADPDLVKPLSQRLTARFGRVRLNTRVTGVEAAEVLRVQFETEQGDDTGTVETGEFDQILVAVGRSPNGAKVTPEAAGLALQGPGFLSVDAQMRSTQPHIFAIGDVVGQPMLAHKAVHEAKVAAEVAMGEISAFEPACIPSVAYTDPEVAWVGLTETEAHTKGIKIKTASFPWAASGRALSLAHDEGVSKLIFDPATRKLLGAGITGSAAGDLIAEAALAIEMGADAQDLSLTIHPHPTLSETLGLAAEIFEGTITDL